jgi:hypothetical protein
VTTALADSVKMYPTPTANDASNAKLRPSQRDRDSIPGALIRDGVTGSLNADWVEWLMGYPTGWTDVDAAPVAFAGWERDPADIGATPRTISGQKNRAARLRGLGNAVVPEIPRRLYLLLDQRLNLFGGRDELTKINKDGSPSYFDEATGKGT